MAQKRTKISGSSGFQERLVYISRVQAFIAPIGVFALCAIGEFLFTDYFIPSRRAPAMCVLAVIVVLLIGRLVAPKTTRSRLAFEYIVLNIVGLVAINYLLHFPSPYMLAGAVISILVYFDFGLEWAILNLIVQYGAVIVTASAKQLSLEQLIDVAAYAVAPLTFAFLVIRLQVLARQEITSIEANANRAVANEQQVQSLINNISDGVIAVDQKLQVIMYNAAAIDILDVNVDVRGQRIDKFLQPIDAQKQAVDLAALLHGVTTQVNNRNLRITYNDGSIANLFLGISPIYLGYGKADNNGYMLLLRDITREKSLEEERDEFISVVSHELRTPITIAEGNISNVQFIAETTATPEMKRALGEAHSQVLFLADMINDLSTLSRAERGKLKVEVEPINVKQLVSELESNYKPEATAKGLTIQTEVDPTLDHLQSSKLYVREILQNFITNAVKYSNEGQVTIHATADPKGVRFAVQDTGIGISKGDQERVFDKFFRSEDYRTRQANGTGLGLYVTMKLTRLIHAEIELQSELNKGSTFSIFIPNLQ